MTESFGTVLLAVRLKTFWCDMKKLVSSIILFAITATYSSAEDVVAWGRLYSNTHEFNVEIDFHEVQTATRPEAYYREIERAQETLANGITFEENFRLFNQNFENLVAAARNNSPEYVAQTYGEIAKMRLVADEMRRVGNWNASQMQNAYGISLRSVYGDQYLADEAFQKAISDLGKIQVRDGDDKLIVRDFTTVNFGDFAEARDRDFARLAGAAIPFKDDCEQFNIPWPDHCRDAAADALTAKLREAEFATLNFGWKSYELQTSRIPSISGVAILVDANEISEVAEDRFRIRMVKNRVRANGKKLEICAGSEFEDQFRSAGGFCTGFLTEIDGEQKLVTAGHCLEKNRGRAYTALHVVFGFVGVPLDGQDFLVPKDQVYRISNMDVSGRIDFGFATKNDFGVVSLDRRVEASVAKPLTLARDVGSSLKAGDILAMVGHPYGRTQKIDYAPRQEIPEPSFLGFEDNERRIMRVATDSSGGNSGSPIFSASTAEVVGILVSGGQDYTSEQDDAGNFCAEPRRIVDVLDAREFAVSVDRILQN